MAQWDFVQDLASVTTTGTAVSTLTATLAGGKSCTVGNLLTARVALTGIRTIGSVTDSKGNTWAVARQNTNGSRADSAAILWCQPTTQLVASDTITIPWTGGTSHGSFIVEEWQNSGTISVDVTVDAIQALTTAVNCGTTAATANAVELVLALAVDQNTKTFTATSPFVGGLSKPTNSTFIREPLGMYRITTATGTQNPTGTLNSGSALTDAVAAFKTTGGGSVQNLGGTIAGSSTFTGSIGVNWQLSGTIAGSST